MLYTNEKITSFLLYRKGKQEIKTSKWHDHMALHVIKRNQNTDNIQIIFVVENGFWEQICADSDQMP